MKRTLILAAIGTLSLLWGYHDLRKKDASQSQRIQSWVQVAAGVLALLFSFLNWKG